jgi:hypothetical protein
MVHEIYRTEESSKESFLFNEGEAEVYSGISITSVRETNSL